MNIPDQWKDLIDIFIERNSKINLSAIRTPEEIYTKHILDALEIQNIPGIDELLQQDGNKKMIEAADIGTGGGFPLLPLAITYPHISRTGIDARKKKIDAINDMISALGLSKNCKGIHTRVEDYQKKYDIITARAMAHSKKLLPWINGILARGGITILYKLFTVEEDRIISTYGRKVLIKHTYTHGEIKKCIYILKKPE